MNLDRCPHGNYSPDNDGFSYACTGCTVPDTAIKIKPIQRETECDENVHYVCPMCASEDFCYADSEHYNCPQCGYDETTV